jgi:hypothetical protein
LAWATYNRLINKIARADGIAISGFLLLRPAYGAKAINAWQA